MKLIKYLKKVWNDSKKIEKKLRKLHKEHEEWREANLTNPDKELNPELYYNGIEYYDTCKKH